MVYRLERARVTMIPRFGDRRRVREELKQRIERGALISTGQNAEDVVLLRLFGHQNRGRYLEVGSAHPTQNSVSFGLYLEGWDGVCIDALEVYQAAHERIRPRDVRLSGVVGSRNQETPFLQTRNLNQSTADPRLVEQYSAVSEGTALRELPTLDLSEALTDLSFPTEFEVLIIDVEGMELSVLASIDLGTFHPSCICVETTLPPVLWADSRLLETQRNEVADFLRPFGYREWLFDGVNSYFLSAEDCESFKTLAYPASFYDDFIPWKVVAASGLSRYSAHRKRTPTRSRRAKGCS